jgi:hypothetical protein
MKKKVDKEDITPEFLKKNDGKIVWIRDDYLSMRDLCKGEPLHDFLEHVVRVKEEVRATGYKFSE